MSKHLLKHVVTGTKSTDGFAMVAPDVEGLQTLLDAGHIEVNPAYKDAEGKIAARATTAGVAAYEADPIVDAPVPVVKPMFDLIGGLNVPKIVRDNSHLKPREEVYPFSKLEVGQSFFIPATDEKPNPGKSFAGTVSAAQRRYKTDDGKFTRKFVIRAVEAGHEYSNGFKEPAKGARVFRTE